MKQSLVQNICRLPGPGTFVAEVSEVASSQHLPFGLRYVCRHWVDHAEHGLVSLLDNGPVHDFLRQSSLYWLEVTSLIGKIPEAVTMMRKLESSIEVSTIT